MWNTSKKEQADEEEEGGKEGRKEGEGGEEVTNMMMRSGWKMRPCQSSCHGQYHYFLFQRNARQQYYSIKQGMSMRHEAGLCNALLSSSHEVFSHEGTHLNPRAHTNASSSAKGANVLLSMDDDELKKLVVSMGEKPFRAKQITDAIYGKSRSKNIMDFRYGRR